MGDQESEAHGEREYNRQCGNGDNCVCTEHREFHKKLETYLELSYGFRNTIAEDHEGLLEVGYHDARTCPNCIMEKAWDDLSEGDIFVLEWFNRNVTNFAIESGLVGEALRRLELSERGKELFLMKVDIIYQHIAKKDIEEIRNG